MSRVQKWVIHFSLLPLLGAERARASAETLRFEREAWVEIIGAQIGRAPLQSWPRVLVDVEMVRLALQPDGDIESSFQPILWALWELGWIGDGSSADANLAFSDVIAPPMGQVGTWIRWEIVG